MPGEADTYLAECQCSSPDTGHSLVAAMGAMDGEPFPVIPSGLPQRYTPDAADGMLHQKSVIGGKLEKIC
jgi:hypothetical protein